MSKENYSEVEAMFNLFKKKDPICGMKQEKGKGFEQNGMWFCSKNCMNEYEKQNKNPTAHKSGCCG